MKQLDIFGEAHEVAGAANRRRLFEDYDAFVGKFKPKKTTDDCYTPPAVYEAVRGWVVGRTSTKSMHLVISWITCQGKDLSVKAILIITKLKTRKNEQRKNRNKRQKQKSCEN